MSSTHILVVDDEPDICSLVRDILEDEGYEVSVAENGEAARHARRTRRPDLILLDIWMQDVDGISLLREWSEGGGLPCPVIMMSGHGSVETAVEATRLGAYDFLEKPISLPKLLLTVERAIEADKLQRENVGLRRRAELPIEPVGRSDTMKRLREQVQRVAQHDSWTLMRGEPGTGKQTLARYLHSQSGRRNGPFVEVGVGSLSQESSALELFGSEEDGNLCYGRLEQANGGTLYLDDIADMDQHTQMRLLSVLQTRSFLRIGGSESVRVDLRIVAATNRDLELAVQEGHFREDLYYHLNVVPMLIPPLREHCEDVPDLVNFYVDYFVENEHLPYRHFSVAAHNFLRNHGWPGNIRELKNLVQRLLILCSGDEVSGQEVQAALSASPVSAVSSGAAAELNLDGKFEMPLREAREQFEKRYLEHQLRASGGSVGRLAKLVGMERTHLYRKLHALDIDIKKGD